MLSLVIADDLEPPFRVKLATEKTEKSQCLKYGIYNYD